MARHEELLKQSLETTKELDVIKFFWNMHLRIEQLEKDVAELINISAKLDSHVVNINVENVSNNTNDVLKAINNGLKELGIKLSTMHEGETVRPSK